MFETILSHIDDIVAVTLFTIGFLTLLLHKNMIKKIIGLNIMDTAIYLLLTVQGFITGRKAPILSSGTASAQDYINPVPSGLVLTGSVVSVSVTALLLSLTIRMYRKYHSMNIDHILMLVEKEDES